MRYAYKHRKENKQKGIEASKWMHKDWTWEIVAKEMLETIDGMTK